MNIEQEIADGTAWLARAPGVKSFGVIGTALYLPTAKDVDFVVLVEGDINQWWPDEGTWAKCSDSYDLEDGWLAVRRDNLNLIVTSDEKWFHDCETAAHVCAALGLTSKSDRVRVHRVVRDGLDFEEARDAPMREGVHD